MTDPIGRNWPLMVPTAPREAGPSRALLVPPSPASPATSRQAQEENNRAETVPFSEKGTYIDIYV